MTCIVGIEHDGRVTIGGDSAGVSGWSVTSRADEKVYRVGPYVLGFTWSFRMGQLLRYELEVEAPPRGDVDRFMAVDFIKAVRRTLKDGGWMKTEHSRDEGGCFLVGVYDRLYYVGSDFQVGRARDGYLAAGCGEDLALGSLHTTEAYEIPPLDRVRLALSAAAYHSGGVCEPFVYVTSRP